MARVAAGTISVHYAGKEDLLQQVYLSIKRDFHDQMMAAVQGSSAQAIKAMWLELFAFLQGRTPEFLFLE